MTGDPAAGPILALWDVLDGSRPAGTDVELVGLVTMTTGSRPQRHHAAVIVAEWAGFGIALPLLFDHLLADGTEVNPLRADALPVDPGHGVEGHLLAYAALVGHPSGRHLPLVQWCDQCVTDIDALTALRLYVHDMIAGGVDQ